MCGIGWHGAMMGFPVGGIGMLLIFGLVAYLVYRLFSSRNDKGNSTALADKSASLEILEARLAKGELSIEEFTKLKEVLQG